MVKAGIPSTVSTNLSSPSWNNVDSDVGFYQALDMTRLEFLDRANSYGKLWRFSWRHLTITNEINEEVMC